jgi:hypothetical protein
MCAYLIARLCNDSLQSVRTENEVEKTVICVKKLRRTFYDVIYLSFDLISAINKCANTYQVKVKVK